MHFILLQSSYKECQKVLNLNKTVNNNNYWFLFYVFLAKSVKLKEDLLSHTTAELNYGLAHFVNEIRRPNGENYAPDSIYYLCLGIQEVSNLMAAFKYNINKKSCGSSCSCSIMEPLLTYQERQRKI